MPVSTLQSLFQYVIASLGQAFSPACAIQNASDFVVTYTNAVTLLDTVLVLNTDYTVTGTATAGVITAPVVTLEASGLHYAVGGTLTIQRKNPATQPTTYVDGTKYLAAVPNNSLDWLAYSIQALYDIVARCLQVPATSPAQVAPILSARKNCLVGFDSNGNFVALTGSPLAPLTGMIRLNSAQTIPNATETNITWSAAVYDEGNAFNPSTPIFVNVPPGTAKMQLMVNLRWVGNATGGRSVKLKDNNNNVWAADEKAAATSGRTSHSLVTPVINVAALGITYFYITVTQDSGGNLNADAGLPGTTTISYRLG